MKFSLNWFKSEQKKEMVNLLIEEQKIKNEILKKETESSKKEEPIPDKPYRKVMLVNDILTIVFNDGSVLTKSNCTQDDFEIVRVCKTELQILGVINDASVTEDSSFDNHCVERAENIRKGYYQLESTGDFEIKDKSVYLKGINRTIPTILVEKFAEIVSKYMEDDEMVNDELFDDVEYQSLKKFWMKCCLNPNARSAEDLYTFLSKHQFKIDRHGNFYAYRRVVSRNDSADKALVDFISNAYNKVKAIWKKSPSDFIVVKDGDGYKLEKKDNIYVSGVGNLQTLYLNLPNMKENSYTSAHTGTEDYRVGEVISMPRHQGDDNNQINCSKGFHQASKEYDYSGFGDTPILTIINPIDVLAVA